MKLIIISFIAIFLSGLSAIGQTKLTWNELSDVTITKDINPEYDVEIMYPVFGNNIQKYDGKEVFIKGFLVPIEIEDGKYALSANPFSSCYFCGKAGQETVIQLNLSSKRRYLGFKLDQVLTFKGTLKLNHTEVTDLIYILDDAELYYGK